MKAIMISIKPKWVAKILNGEKTIEVRLRFPKDYRGWVYIYCTKNGETLTSWVNGKGKTVSFTTVLKNIKFIKRNYNGKVVARFWCDFDFKTFIDLAKSVDEYKPLLKDSCLTNDELEKYVGKNFFYAIHISQLEIFDKPRELSEFEKVGSYNNPTIKCKKKEQGRCNYGKSEFTGKWVGCEKARLTKAPQSYCFIESEE